MDYYKIITYLSTQTTQQILNKSVSSFVIIATIDFKSLQFHEFYLNALTDLNDSLIMNIMYKKLALCLDDDNQYANSLPF